MGERNPDAQASQAGRELARARWGTATLDRAVSEVVQRAGELTGEQRAELREVTQEAGSDE